MRVGDGVDVGAGIGNCEGKSRQSHTRPSNVSRQSWAPHPTVDNFCRVHAHDLFFVRILFLSQKYWFLLLRKQLRMKNRKIRKINFMKNPWGGFLPQIFVKNVLFEKLTNYSSLDVVLHADSEYVITFAWHFFCAEKNEKTLYLSPEVFVYTE